MWNFPTTEELSVSTSTMASLFTETDAPELLIGATRHQDLTIVEGGTNVDAAAWIDQSSGRGLVSVVNLNYDTVSGPVTISLPDGTLAESVTDGLWGSTTWEVGPNGTLSVAEGLSGLETAVFLISLG